MAIGYEILGLARSLTSGSPSADFLSQSPPSDITVPVIPGQFWHLTPNSCLRKSSKITEILHVGLYYSPRGYILIIAYRNRSLLLASVFTSGPGTVLFDCSPSHAIHGANKRSSHAIRFCLVLISPLNAFGYTCSVHRSPSSSGEFTW